MGEKTEETKNTEGNGGEKGEEKVVTYGMTRSGEMEKGRLNPKGKFVRDIEQDMTAEQWHNYLQGVSEGPVTGIDRTPSLKGTYEELAKAATEDGDFNSEREDGLYPPERVIDDNTRAYVREINDVDFNETDKVNTLASRFIESKINSDTVPQNGIEVQTYTGNNPGVEDLGKGTIREGYRNVVASTILNVLNEEPSLEELGKLIDSAKQSEARALASEAIDEEIASANRRNVISAVNSKMSHSIIEGNPNAKQYIEERIDLLLQKNVIEVGDQNADIIATKIAGSVFNALEEVIIRGEDFNLEIQDRYYKTLAILDLLTVIGDKTGQSEEWISSQLRMNVTKAMNLFSSKMDSNSVHSLYALYNRNSRLADADRIEINSNYSEALEFMCRKLIIHGMDSDALELWSDIDKAHSLDEKQKLGFVNNMREQIRGIFFTSLAEDEIYDNDETYDNLVARYNYYLNNMNNLVLLFGSTKAGEVHGILKDGIHSAISSFFIGRVATDVEGTAVRLRRLESNPSVDRELLGKIREDIYEDAKNWVNRVPNFREVVGDGENFERNYDEVMLFISGLLDNNLITVEEYRPLLDKLLSIKSGSAK